MWENIEQDKHYTGVFNILDEQLSGELIYNKKNGLIILNIIRQLTEKSGFGKSYGSLAVITGKLNSGAPVTLFNNKCINNHTHNFQSQQLNFNAKYMIWGNIEDSGPQYNKMICILKNAYAWSGLTAFEESGAVLKAKESAEIKEFNWFGAKITFSTYLNNWLIVPPLDEDTKIIQRLNLEIELDSRQDVKNFISVRNKILSLISFSIKDNVNIEEEYMYNYDDSYILVNDIVDYRKHYLMTSDNYLECFNTQIWDYNFTLNQLPAQKDINNELTNLEPIFNLYLSLFKYRDMPAEMVFLNIVQALETFHSRFFYNNKKEDYVESVMKRFGESPHFEKLKKLLLCPTQKDDNCNYIILVSRLNDLLIGDYDGLFYEYYEKDENYAQIIVDTRHYYTHYGKSKEAKALKNDELLEAIYILRVLLEYHICLVLGIDNRKKIVRELHNHNSRRQLSEIQSHKIAQNVDK